MVGEIDFPEIGEGKILSDEADRWIVKVDINQPIGVPLVDSKLREARARARAIATTGFKTAGSLTQGDVEVRLPQLKRRTEIKSVEKVDEDSFRYTVHVNKGILA